MTNGLVRHISVEESTTIQMGKPKTTSQPTHWRKILSKPKKGFMISVPLFWYDRGTVEKDSHLSSSHFGNLKHEDKQLMSMKKFSYFDTVVA